MNNPKTNEPMIPLFNLGAEVGINFMRFEGKIPNNCYISAVTFNDLGKIEYDIRVPVGFMGRWTTLEGIPEYLVEEPVFPEVLTTS